jgi:hypothetical protein
VRHERLSILANILKRGGCRLTGNIYGNGHEMIPEAPPVINGLFYSMQHGER